MRGPEEWPSCRSNPADRIRLTGPAATNKGLTPAPPAGVPFLCLSLFYNCSFLAMPSYWPDKPHKPAFRGPIDKFFYRLYLRFGIKSHFWARIWSEHEVHRILKVLARQQVHGFVANPEGGDPIWYVDAPEDVQENRYPLNTCLLRGWIEELDRGNQSYKGFPVALRLLAPGQSFDDFPKPPYYRLTAAGWNAFKGQYTLSRVALMVTALGLMISLVSFVISVSKRTEPPILKVVFPAPPPHSGP